MKNLRFLLFAVLSLAAVSAPLTSANNSGPSSDGEFGFSLADGTARLVQFHAKKNSDGSTKGERTYSDQTTVPDSEDGLGSSGLFAMANIDCLVVNGKKSVMSGEITEATVGDYLGNRILRIVEDNGEGKKPADLDKLAWGVYRVVNPTWIPQDAEIPGDQGALLEWLASDFERTDDVPVPARPSRTIGCQSFSLSSYAFEAVQHGAGNIQVKP